MADYSYYTRRIRDIREDNDLTQQQIAEILGTSQTMYARYERGANELPIRHLIRLAEYYRLSTDYLLGLTNEKKPYPSKKIKTRGETVWFLISSLFYLYTAKPSQLFCCSRDNLFFIVASAIFANTVWYHQSATFTAFYQSWSSHLPVCSTLISSRFRRFILRTDTHVDYTSSELLKHFFHYTCLT